MCLGREVVVKLKPLHIPSGSKSLRLCGKLAVIVEPVSLLGDIDVDRGLIKGVEIADRVVLMPYGIGSTVGSYIIYALRKCGKSPKALVVAKADSVTAIGAVISDVPLYQLNEVNASEGLLRSIKKYEGMVACIEGGGKRLVIGGGRS